MSLLNSWLRVFFSSFSLSFLKAITKSKEGERAIVSDKRKRYIKERKEKRSKELINKMKKKDEEPIPSIVNREK